MANAPADRAPALARLSDRPPAVVARWQGLTAETVPAALGRLEPGGRVFWVSKGALSLNDVLAWLLGQIGSADVLVSTWTVGQDEIGALRRLLDDGAIRSLRLLVDASFPQRHPAYADDLRATFGPAAVALTACHAKLATLVNDAWAIVVLTSANLNRNSRLEYFEVADDRGLAIYLLETLGEWFPAAPDTWLVSRAEHRQRFDAWRAEAPAVGLDRPGDGWPAGDLAGWARGDTEQAALLRALAGGLEPAEEWSWSTR